MKLTYKDGSLEYAIEGDTLFILSIFVEERRQGTATHLINMLLEKAEDEDVNYIHLPAMSFDDEEGMSTEELKDWFERMGFDLVEKYSIGDKKGYLLRKEL